MIVPRVVFLFLLISVLTAAAAAQEPPPTPPPATPPTAPPPPPPEYKWFAGGAVGLAFGNQVDYAEFSPLISYKITQRFQLGASLTFRYRKDKRFEPDLVRTDFGASLLGRYYVFGPIFVQAEVERLRFEYIDRLDDDEFESVKSTYTGVYGGFGFVQRSAGRGALYMAFLWDFTHNDNEPNPRSNPFRVQIGYGIRF